MEVAQQVVMHGLETSAIVRLDDDLGSKARHLP